jgi:hypothetical protein
LGGFGTSYVELAVGHELEMKLRLDEIGAVFFPIRSEHVIDEKRQL